jgi:hypothetical protein
LIEWLSLPIRIRQVVGPNPHAEEQKKKRDFVVELMFGNITSPTPPRFNDLLSGLFIL